MTCVVYDSMDKNEKKKNNAVDLGNAVSVLRPDVNIGKTPESSSSAWIGDISCT